MENEVEIEVDVRAIAHHELEQARASRQTILEEHSSSFKWLMASMLAINSGGLLAISDMDGIEGVHRVAAAAFFVVGVLGALAVAWLGQIMSRKMLVPLSEMIAFWAVVAASGHFDADAHNGIGEKIQTVVTKQNKARYAGWASVSAFVLGVIFIGLGIRAEGAQPIYSSDALADTVEMPADESAASPSDAVDPTGAKKVFREMK